MREGGGEAKQDEVSWKPLSPKVEKCYNILLNSSFLATLFFPNSLGGPIIGEGTQHGSLFHKKRKKNSFLLREGSVQVVWVFILVEERPQNKTKQNNIVTIIIIIIKITFSVVYQKL